VREVDPPIRYSVISMGIFKRLTLMLTHNPLMNVVFVHLRTLTVLTRTDCHGLFSAATVPMATNELTHDPSACGRDTTTSQRSHKAGMKGQAGAGKL
jgi:hypothetical protein